MFPQNPRYNPSFIQWLDDYPKNRILYPGEFYHIIHQINQDYVYNEYYSPQFSGGQNPRGGTTSPAVDAFFTQPCSPVKRKRPSPLWTNQNEWENIDETFNQLVEDIQSGDFFKALCSKTEPEPEPKPVVHTPPESKKTYQHIDDPVDTIADLIAIVDKYPADGEYNIDVSKLANIRSELEELHGMIGMTALKRSVLDQLVYFIQGLHTSEIVNGSKGTGDFKHTVIYGPPGTGKTEIAKIIGKMYSKLGILKNNVFKKATRNDLVAGYLGQTAIKTKNIINDCLGGVLFIDEAYSLSNANHLDSFSKECIDTLCEALSDHKDDLMVIVAGYEDELEQHFFQSNPGLNSRFVWRFKVDSYTPTELADIFRKKVDDAGWKLADENVADARWFEKHKKTFLHFGRDMEILLFYTKIRHSRRVFGKSADNHQTRTITKEDVEKGLALFLDNTKRPDEKYRQMLESLYI